MNKLNETSSSKVKVLDEGELSQVVGGYGYHRRWGGGQNGGEHSMSKGGSHSMSKGGGGGGHHNFGGGPRVVFNITVNNTTIINNTTLVS